MGGRRGQFGPIIHNTSLIPAYLLCSTRDVPGLLLCVNDCQMFFANPNLCPFSSGLNFVKHFTKSVGHSPNWKLLFLFKSLDCGTVYK